MITNCDHLAKLKFSKSLPFAFTEYGAVALANVLASSQAVEMGIYVVRAFVRLRQAATVHADLAKRLLCVFRKSVTDRFGIVTADFGNVTDHFGDVTEGTLIPA